MIRLYKNQNHDAPQIRLHRMEAELSALNYHSRIWDAYFSVVIGPIRKPFCTKNTFEPEDPDIRGSRVLKLGVFRLR